MWKRKIDFTPKTGPIKLQQEKINELEALKQKDHKEYAYVKDVCEILGIGRAHAYDIIKKLQSELPDKGRSEPSGRIPRKFLMSKLYGEDTEDTEEKDGPMDL